MDEVPIVPSSNWTMDKCGVKRVEMIGVGDKRQITEFFVALFLGISPDPT